MPIQSSPRSAATSPVVPLPMNGSRTGPSSIAARQLRASSGGKGAGCGVPVCCAIRYTQPSALAFGASVNSFFAIR